MLTTACTSVQRACCQFFTASSQALARAYFHNLAAQWQIFDQVSVEPKPESQEGPAERAITNQAHVCKPFDHIQFNIIQPLYELFSKLGAPSAVRRQQVFLTGGRPSIASKKKLETRTWSIHVSYIVSYYIYRISTVTGSLDVLRMNIMSPCLPTV